MFLGDDPPIELVALGLLFFELLIPPGLESRKPLLEAARRAPIEPDRRLGQIREQPFVVADQDEGGSRVLAVRFPATRSPRDRDGSSVRRAAGCPAPPPGRAPGPPFAPRRRKVLRDRPRDAPRDPPCTRGPGTRHRRRPDRPGQNRESSRSRSDRALVAGSAAVRWAARSGFRRPPRSRRQRCEAASTSPTHCGRRARCGRRAKSSAPRRRARARRRASGGCLAVAIGAPYEANSIPKPSIRAASEKGKGLRWKPRF